MQVVAWGADNPVVHTRNDGGKPRVPHAPSRTQAKADQRWGMSCAGGSVHVWSPRRRDRGGHHRCSDDTRRAGGRQQADCNRVAQGAHARARARVKGAAAPGRLYGAAAAAAATAEAGRGRGNGQQTETGPSDAVWGGNARPSLPKGMVALFFMMVLVSKPPPKSLPGGASRERRMR
ncbi:MAG: hypothetical protein J3K34DRAFT_430115 [Monoraphidium minutum]|nr:MAG: hypothetical protein J3K34DRAFT_430115 [Monoraphidium minutum]